MKTRKMQETFADMRVNRFVVRPWAFYQEQERSYRYRRLLGRVQKMLREGASLSEIFPDKPELRAEVERELEGDSLYICRDASAPAHYLNTRDDRLEAEFCLSGEGYFHKLWFMFHAGQRYGRREAGMPDHLDVKGAKK